MGNKGVKVIAVLLVCILCFMLRMDDASAIESISNNDSTLDAIIREERALYVKDPMFHMEAAEKGYSFEEFIEIKARRILKKRSLSKYQVRGIGNNGQILYTNVPLIQQPNSYYCGPTSALQAIYGMGMQNSVSGSSNYDKICTLASNSDTNTSGTIVYKLVNTLNYYTPSQGDYEYVNGSNLSLSSFQSRVETSLYYDFAPILHAKTAYLDYYGGHQSGHYIAISELDKTNSKIRVQDCNNNNSYYGSHYEDISHFYNSIHSESQRYLICYEL